ncbi:Hypothetical_protein [Hexamita inflata]|uniref:Hypothetical_protein n=1 Tax=Hexamita inflata TaxID=28002 RepID=A0ABP1LUU4_9EUKA
MHIFLTLYILLDILRHTTLSQLSSFTHCDIYYLLTHAQRNIIFQDMILKIMSNAFFSALQDYNVYKSYNHAEIYSVKPMKIVFKYKRSCIEVQQMLQRKERKQHNS